MENKRKLKTILYSLVALLGVFFSLGTLVPSAGVCDEVGTSGMSSKAQINLLLDPVLKDTGSRKYTILELFGNSYRMSYPNGETKGGLVRSENNAVSSKVKLTKKAKENLEETGKKSFLTCSIGHNAKAGIYEFSASITESVTGFIRMVIVKFFDSHLICDENSTSGCFDILGLSGGRNKVAGDGLIGSISKGVFIPLTTLAFLTTAIWLIYNGLYKHEYRTSLGGLLWALFAFILGLLTMYRPWIVARAPFVANEAISGCLLNVLSGGDCLSDSDSMQRSDDQACTSYTTGQSSTNSKSQMALNAIGCNITKGFTVDRWAYQQFGYHFNQLYTKNPPIGYTVYKVDNPDDFCVNVYSTSSPQTMFDNLATKGQDEDINEVIKTEKTVQICNIAVAYMAATTVGDFGGPSMEKIVATAANDDVMWQAMNGDSRDLLGFSQIIASIVIAISFIPIAIVGLAYSFIASLLMVFAPVFLLFAIHPGRGKKIFLGWLETVLGYIMKYFAIGLLMIIMLAVYQAAFTNTVGATTLVLSIVLATAFSLYRKEVVNLIGAVSLGGVKMANKAGEFVDKVNKKGSALGKATVGGALGGVMAAKADDKNHEGETAAEKAQRYRDSLKQGTGKAVNMEMRRGRGFLANMARTQQQVKDANTKALEKEILDDKRDSFRSEVLDTLDKQTSTVNDSVNRNFVEREQARLKAAINSARPNVSNQAINSVLDNVEENISTATTPTEAIKATMRGELEVEEALRVNSVIKKAGTGNIGNAFKDYVQENVREAENNVQSLTDELVEALKDKGVDPDKASEDVLKFMDKNLEKTSELGERLEEALKTTTFGETRTVIKNINIPEIVQAKEDYKEKLEKIKSDFINEKLK